MLFFHQNGNDFFFHDKKELALISLNINDTVIAFKR